MHEQLFSGASSCPPAMSNFGLRQQVSLEHHYSIGAQLGRGRYGSVYAGIRIADELPVAIKYVQKTEGNQLLLTGEEVWIPREVELMRLVNQQAVPPNILCLHEWFDAPDHYAMVLEHPEPCVDLSFLSESLNYCLNEQQAQLLAIQLLQALLHCQQSGVFHGDVKPGNILLNTETQRIILIDFGSGDFWRDTSYNTFAGTELFAPPEWFAEGKFHAGPATVWSVGVTMYKLLCGYLPFDVNDLLDGSKMLEFPEGLSTDIMRIIAWCLVRSVEQRATLAELLDLRWFDSISQTEVRTTEQERQSQQEEELGCSSSSSSEVSESESAEGEEQIRRCVWESQDSEWESQDSEWESQDSEWESQDSSSSHLALIRRGVEDREEERRASRGEDLNEHGHSACVPGAFTPPDPSGVWRRAIQPSSSLVEPVEDRAVPDQLRVQHCLHPICTEPESSCVPVNGQRESPVLEFTGNWVTGIPENGRLDAPPGLAVSIQDHVQNFHQGSEETALRQNLASRN